MPIRRFALERNGPKRLEISWKGRWKDFRVRAGGADVGFIVDKSGLQAGREFGLPDGSHLHARLTRQLTLLRDGRPIPGSATDPASILKVAYAVIFFIGGGWSLGRDHSRQDVEWSVRLA